MRVICRPAPAVLKTMYHLAKLAGLAVLCRPGTKQRRRAVGGRRLREASGLGGARRPPPEAHRAAMDLRGKADLQKLMEVSGRPYRRRRFFAKTTELSSFRVSLRRPPPPPPPPPRQRGATRQLRGRHLVCPSLHGEPHAFRPLHDSCQFPLCLLTGSRRPPSHCIVRHLLKTADSGVQLNAVEPQAPFCCLSSNLHAALCRGLQFVDDDDEVKADEIQEFERWEKASAKGAPMPNPTIRVAPVVQDRIEDIVLSL